MHALALSVLTVICLALGAGLALLFFRIRRLDQSLREVTEDRDGLLGFMDHAGEALTAEEGVELDVLLKRVVEFARQVTHGAAASVYLYDPEQEAFQAHAVAGPIPPLQAVADSALEQTVSRPRHLEKLVMETIIPAGEGVLGLVANGNGVLVSHAEGDARVPQYASDFMKLDTLIVAPMRYRNQVLGAIAVANRVNGSAFGEREMRLLQAVADQASITVHFGGLSETLQQKQTMDFDIDVARQIQRSLLPEDIPNIPGLELAAFNHPARRIGGDYYDFIPLDEEHLGIAIADVSGKGVAGALMMSICRSVLRAQARGIYSPARVLQALNEVLSLDITEDMFVTLLYMVLNTRTRELVVARAGHEKPILWRSGEGRIEYLDSAGVAIGIGFPEIMETSLEEIRVQLDVGDIIVAYTDGVTEAMNDARQEWGLDSLVDAVRAGTEQSAGRILHNVNERLQRFVGDQAQYDDTTLIVLRVVD